MTEEPTYTYESDWSHDMRKLRWQNKQLGKALGKSGAKIHELRCQLAELREINHRIARGELRDMERQIARDADIIATLRAANAMLGEQNQVLRKAIRTERTEQQLLSHPLPTPPIKL